MANLSHSSYFVDVNQANPDLPSFTEYKKQEFLRLPPSYLEDFDEVSESHYNRYLESTHLSASQHNFTLDLLSDVATASIFDNLCIAFQSTWINPNFKILIVQDRPVEIFRLSELGEKYQQINREVILDIASLLGNIIVKPKQRIVLEVSGGIKFLRDIFIKTSPWINPNE